MSRVGSMPKVVLVGATLASLGLIYYVHNEQKTERDRLHEGVLRDQERQRYKQMLRDLSNR